MRACATANALFLGTVLAAFGFGACAGGSTPPAPAPGSDTPATTVATAAPVTTSSVAPVPIGPQAGGTKKSAPKTVADCKNLMSDITNDPPANGVVMNNAQTARDAGSSDRVEPITEIIRSKRDGFRCCFDIWAKDHPGASGAVKMVIKLKSDGAVTSVDFDDTPNRVNANEVEGCMRELASGLTYPRSPSGKETKFTYPFDFKARK